MTGLERRRTIESAVAPVQSLAGSVPSARFADSPARSGTAQRPTIFVRRGSR